jgi:hypothetical protein
MGKVRWGIPKDLVCLLKNEFEIKTFIETGTFRGGTALWASSVFNEVLTVEASADFYEYTKKRIGPNPRVSLSLGTSPGFLRSVLPTIHHPSLLWLDAHYSGGNTFGETNECPLIEELQEINKCSENHFILIDDARLFLSPVYYGHNSENWPTIDQVLSLIQQGGHKKYVVIFEDVIFAVPMFAKQVLQERLRKLNTALFLEQEKQENNSLYRLRCHLRDLYHAFFPEKSGSITISET